MKLSTEQQTMVKHARNKRNEHQWQRGQEDNEKIQLTRQCEDANKQPDSS